MGEHECELGIIILAVSDLQRSSSFYDQAFTWSKIVDTPVYIEYLLPNKIRVGLYDCKGFSRNTDRIAQLTETGRTSSTEIYLYCTDLKNSIRQIADAGAETLSPLIERDWGDRAAYFSDPDGNVIVLAERI